MRFHLTVTREGRVVDEALFMLEAGATAYATGVLAANDGTQAELVDQATGETLWRWPEAEAAAS